MATIMGLIRKLRSPETKVVLEAIEELRARGWLEDGSLSDIPLLHVHMEGADLAKADLHNTDLHQAHLQDANLSMVNFSRAKLSRANLMGADLSKANLQNADLFKAQLSEVRNLNPEQLKQAQRLFGATMPDGSTYDGRYNLPGDIELAKWGKVNPADPEAMAYFFGVSLETYQKGQKLLARSR